MQLVSGGWPRYLQRELEAWIGQDVVAMDYNWAEIDQSVTAGGAGSHNEKAEIYGREIAGAKNTPWFYVNRPEKY